MSIDIVAVPHVVCSRRRIDSFSFDNYESVGLVIEYSEE